MLGGLAVAAGVAALARAAWSIPVEMGARRSAIRPFAAASPHWRSGTFHNAEPAHPGPTAPPWRIAARFATRGRVGKPPTPIPVVAPQFPDTVADLAVTWLGHASALIEIDGATVLADPVWSERVSPSTVVGPARLHPVPSGLDELPRLDAVVISHDHYDHLDRRTLLALRDLQEVPFVVPVGVGAHLRRWGIAEQRIVELDWDDSVELGGIRLTCTPARHFSGRGLTRNPTLWSSWVLAGPQHRVFFGGDTGYTRQFAEIGDRYGPFDVTVLPVGAYDEMWHEIHMDPEEAVRAHRDLRGGLLLPIHWATFDLAFHPWVEPATRLVSAARDADVPVLIPRPGERTEIDDARPVGIVGLREQPDSVSPWWITVAAGRAD